MSTAQHLHVTTRRFGFLYPSLLATLIMLWAQSPAALFADSPGLTLSDGQGTITDLTIGDDLWVTLSGGPANTTVLLVVKDEANTIVSRVTALTDSTGSVLAETWPKTGTVGCGVDANPDLLSYRFPSYTDAETILDTRTFTVEAVDPSHNTVLASTPLPLVNQSRTRAYMADGTGCPVFQRQRCEPIYFNVEHLDPQIQELRVFLVEPLDPTTTQLNDVRNLPSGQVISTTSNGISLPELMWIDPDNTLELQLIIRASISGPTDPTPIAVQTDYTSVTTPPTCPPSGRFGEEETDECPRCSGGG